MESSIEILNYWGHKYPANNTNMVQTLQVEKGNIWDIITKKGWGHLYPVELMMTFIQTHFIILTSIRGYKYSQMFAYKYSKFERIELMRREANAPDAYEDIIRAIGAPDKAMTDNTSILQD